MSYTVDVNILLYASDGRSPFHAAAKRFMRGRADDPNILLLTWPTVMSYVRLATDRRVFDSPMTPAMAIDNVADVLALPQCRMVGETENFLDTYRDIAFSVDARGPLVPDAHLAALMREHDIHTIYTHDRDFRRFPFLNVIDPVG